jgi:drug/metabolite transporter (DMT)-like permease
MTRRPSIVYAAAVIALLLWAGTPIANKVAVATIDPATAGLLRSMLAGVAAAALARAMRLPFPSEPRQRWLLLVSGIASFVIWPLLFSVGIGLTTASRAALIVAIIPVATGLIAGAFERRWPHGSWWAGTAVALAGGALLVLFRDGISLAADRVGVIGDLVVLAGIGFCGLGYVAGGRLTPIIGTWATTFWGLALSTIVLIPCVALLAPRTDWSAVTATGWAAVVYMTLCSSLLGYCAWFWALGHGGITRISALQLGQPILTIVIAAAWLAEPITAPLLAAAAIILAGTWLAQRPRSMIGSGKPRLRDRKRRLW